LELLDLAGADFLPEEDIYNYDNFELNVNEVDTMN